MAGKILFERSTFIKPKCRYYPKPEFFCFEKKLNDATTMATLSYQKGKDTFETVHMWTQIVGKIKLALLPWINHSWYITLMPTRKGLSTVLIPYGDYNFRIEFDSRLAGQVPFIMHHS